MGIAISDDHLELSGVAEAFLANAGALAEARALLDAPEETLPAAWKEMADLGWLGLHLPEAHGGSGYGLAELALVVEAMGAVGRARALPPHGVGVGGDRSVRHRGPAGRAAPRAGRRLRARRGRARRPHPPRARRRPGRPVPAARRRRPRRSRRATRSASSMPVNTDATRRVGTVTTDGTRARRSGARRRARHRRRARPRPRRRRGHRRRAGVRHHGERVRQGARAVRPRHRDVPGGEAPAPPTCSSPPSSPPPPPGTPRAPSRARPSSSSRPPSPPRRPCPRS